jgi:hypothetical protein
MNPKIKLLGMSHVPKVGVGLGFSPIVIKSNLILKSFFKLA